MIKIYNLSYYYDSSELILDKISFKIQNNSIFSIIGSNGSGKTTLLSLISGLLQSERNMIFINNVASNKDIYYAPSEDILPDFLTGKEYLELLKKFYRVEILESDENNLFRILDLSKAKNTLIKSYSHGMKKKLIIICGLLINPKIFIIDETLNGVDYISKKIIIKLLKEYKKRNENIIIFCTHDIDILPELVDQVLLLSKNSIDIVEDIKNISEYELVIDKYFKHEFNLRGINNVEEL
jgi:ABC-2 type transport system ATP-binding protein